MREIFAASVTLGSAGTRRVLAYKTLSDGQRWLFAASALLLYIKGGSDGSPLRRATLRNVKPASPFRRVDPAKGKS